MVRRVEKLNRASSRAEQDFVRQGHTPVASHEETRIVGSFAQVGVNETTVALRIGHAFLTSLEL